MKSRRGLLLIILVLGLVTWYLAASWERPEPSFGDSSRSSAAVGSEFTVKPKRTDRQRIEAEIRDRAPSPITAAVVSKGQVVSLLGRGQAYVGVRHSSSDTRVRSGLNGEFSISLTTLSGDLVVEDPRFVGVTRARVAVGLRHKLVVAPGGYLAGRVYDMDGAIVGAVVRLETSAASFAGLPVAFKSAVQVDWTAISGPNGDYVFERAPSGLEGAILSVVHTGHERWQQTLDLDPGHDQTTHCDVELKSLRDVGTFVSGIVIGASGEVAGGADVRLGSRYRAFADDLGRFELQVGAVEETDVLTAYRRGQIPYIGSGFGMKVLAVREEGGALRDLELRLGGPLLEISGHVADAAGRACAGWFVTVLDGTLLSLDAFPAATLARLVGHGDKVLTADDGSFVIEGLSDRAYDLIAWDPDTLLRLRQSGVRAGTAGVTLRGAKRSLGKLHGRIVDRHGTGLVGIDVTPVIVIFDSEFGQAMARGSGIKTNEDGFFEFDCFPTLDAHIHLAAQSILSEFVYLDKFQQDRDSGRPITIATDRMRPIRVVVEAASEVTAIRALDSEGRRLPLFMVDGDGHQKFNKYYFQGKPATPVLFAPGRAESIEYLFHGDVLGKIAIYKSEQDDQTPQTLKIR